MKSFSAILIDVSNVYFRVLSACRNKVDPQKVFEQYKKVIESFSEETEKVCLLFDPFYKDSVEPPSNRQLTIRQSLMEKYKANRLVAKQDEGTEQERQVRLTVLGLLYDEYVNLGSKVDVYYNISLEADDFAGELCKKYNRKVLMVTSDLDWARYLDGNRVFMLRKGFKISPDTLYTAKAFEFDHAFYPTYESVVLWKAVFGDTSDNICGAANHPKTQIYRSTANMFHEAITQVSNTNKAEPHKISLYDISLASTLYAEDRPSDLPAIKSYKEALRKAFLEMTDICFKDHFLNTILNNIEIVKSYVNTQEELNANLRKTKVSYTEKDQAARAKTLMALFPKSKPSER